MGIDYFGSAKVTNTRPSAGDFKCTFPRFALSTLFSICGMIEFYDALTVWIAFAHCLGEPMSIFGIKAINAHPAILLTGIKTDI